MAGDPGDPPVVLLHGFFSDGRMWAPLVAHFTTTYRLRRLWLAVDLPGHGLSCAVKPDDPAQTWPWLLELLDELWSGQAEPPALVGYSMGARIAGWYALAPRMGGERPTVTRLVLESGHCGVAQAERPARQAVEAALAEQVCRHGVAAFAAFWRTHPLFAGRLAQPNDVTATLDALRLEQRSQGLAFAQRYLGTGAMPSLVDLPPRLDIEVLLLAGAQDLTYVGQLAQWQTRFARATCTVVPECGHHVAAQATQLWSVVVAGHLGRSVA